MANPPTSATSHGQALNDREIEVHQAPKSASRGESQSGLGSAVGEGALSCWLFLRNVREETAHGFLFGDTPHFKPCLVWFSFRKGQ